MKVTRSASLIATISDVSCGATSVQNGNTQYSCTYTATYTLDGSGQSILITTTSSTTNLNGTTITLYYNPADHSDISNSSGNYYLIGWICIGLIAVGTIVWVYLAHRFKALTASQGVANSIGIIKNAFQTFVVVKNSV